MSAIPSEHITPKDERQPIVKNAWLICLCDCSQMQTSGQRMQRQRGQNVPWRVNKDIVHGTQRQQEHSAAVQTSSESRNGNIWVEIGRGAKRGSRDEQFLRWGRCALQCHWPFTVWADGVQVAILGINLSISLSFCLSLFLSLSVYHPLCSISTGAAYIFICLQSKSANYAIQRGKEEKQTTVKQWCLLYIPFLLLIHLL